MIKTTLNQLIAGERPNKRQFSDIFSAMISGEMPDAQITALLTAYEMFGISALELSVGAKILRANMLAINAPKGTIDIVGTGGDGLSTFNISTACAFVCAGAGLPVAKHGNRAVSSKSGASDVLRALGVKLDISIAVNEDCLEKAGVTFLFAPNHHPAMAAVGPARAKLGIKTLFNRLGPLCNPASVRHYLLGVSDNDLRVLYSDTLKELGTERALIVHGEDGMDEISTTGATYATELRGGKATETIFTPGQFNLKQASLKDLEGGDPAFNANALNALLEGKHGPYRDIVCINSGAAFVAGGVVADIEQGIELARQSIDSGKAKTALETLIRVSNG